MDEEEKYKLLLEISEVSDVIKPYIRRMILFLLGYVVTLIIVIIEAFRVGVLDGRTIGWFIMSIILGALLKNNRVPSEYLDHYANLVREYKKKLDDE